MTGSGRALLQAAAVLLGGVVLGVVGNGLSPVGLSLTRDYFPLDHGAQAPANPPGATPASADPSPSLVPPVPLETGVQRIDPAEARALFEDPRREADLVVFIDARDRSAYDRGHIPGAYLFDHYHPENHVAEVLPVCQTAELVVVYCKGGSCEDSLLTAVTLREMGVPGDHLRLYEAGFTDWSQAGLPVETGPRLSGQLLPATQ
ncbi:MAG: hypothetical protein H7A46_17580 [Verrucomicrobiales bacterium]|nr:hypothetical protein [Verrucomicrobiales bacterium]